MTQRKICLLGGSGFVGSYIAEALVRHNFQVRVLTRYREQAKHLLVLPTVEILEVNIHDETSLNKAFTGYQTVINTVGILHESKGLNSFEKVHVDLTQKVINACLTAKIDRYLHMSALNAAIDGPSKYLRSKGKAEAIVLAAKDKLPITIFRPSVIFGPGDSFLNQVAGLIKLFPILPLGSANAQFQPVFVEDVARIFVNSLQDRRTYGQSYDVCGPTQYTLHSLVQFIAAIMHKSRTIIDLSPALTMLQAAALEFLPRKILTRDNVRTMTLNSVCECEFETQFGFKPTSLAAIAPTYLAGETPRGRYHYFRYHARRR